MKISFLALSLLIVSCDEPLIDSIASEIFPLSESELTIAKDTIDIFPIVYPVDESVGISDLYNFRSELIHAIADQDTTFIYSILSENIELNFGGSYGISEFKNFWQLENDGTEFWSKISTALGLGGSLSEDSTTYIFPYMFKHLPKGYDEYFSVIGTSESSRVFYQPNESSAFDTTSYTVFEVIPSSWPKEEFSKDYIPVHILQNRYAYVKTCEFRSAIDFRGGLEKIDGEWKLVFWIAGD